MKTFTLPATFGASREASQASLVSPTVNRLGVTKAAKPSARPARRSEGASSRNGSILLPSGSRVSQEEAETYWRAMLDFSRLDRLSPRTVRKMRATGDFPRSAAPLFAAAPQANETRKSPQDALRATHLESAAFGGVSRRIVALAQTSLDLDAFCAEVALENASTNARVALSPGRTAQEQHTPHDPDSEAAQVATPAATLSSVTRTLPVTAGRFYQRAVAVGPGVNSSVGSTLPPRRLPDGRRCYHTAYWRKLSPSKEAQ